jgi:prophage antirepressor-like protein
MNDIKIFNHPVFGQVRVIDDNASGELLFCANDVTHALEYANGRKAVADHVDSRDILKRDIGVVTGKKADGTDAYQTVNTTFINESGVYSLIFSSKQERAKEFKHWVTSEVLPSIRKTGQYSANVSSATLNEQLQANLTFADWAIKTLNINEASKLGWAKKISDKFGLAAELPNAVNAGTEKPITHAATDLLKSHNVGISAQAFNRMLELKGVVKHATRPGKRGKMHSWYVITPAFDKYGQNQQDPKFQQQTQIRWYDATFTELLTIVGLNSQTSLNLN